MNAIEGVLEEHIGLSVDAVGAEVIAKAVRQRMEACGLSGVSAYLLTLLESPQELQSLIETVVIPETWFFRNKQSFRYLEFYIRTEWLPTQGDNPLRVLSVPCSTGEEPYSIAITLLEAGLPEDRMTIDAVDVSQKALDKARSGVYGPESFRDKDNLGFRERYFQQVADAFQLDESLKHTVRFLRGNLLKEDFLASESPYHIIFCRNLLIYLGESAKHQAVTTLQRCLAKNGLLFVGHAERPAFNAANVSWIRQSGVFACRKAGSAQKTPQPEPSLPKKPPVKADTNTRKNSTSLNVSRRTVRHHGQKALPRRTGSELPSPQFERRTRRIAEAHTPGQSPTSSRDVERRNPTSEAMKLLDAARQKADQGELEEALVICDNVLDHSAADPQAHFLKGLIFQALGDDEKAEQWLNKTVYLDPNNAEALHYLTFLAEYHGNHSRAEVLRQRMKRIQDKSVRRQAQNAAECRQSG